MTKPQCKASPIGIWDYQNLIGARVRVKSQHISNFSQIDSSEIFTLDDVYFRVSLDGKITTIYKIKELPDMFFTNFDLELLSVSKKSKKICGQFICGSEL